MAVKYNFFGKNCLIDTKLENRENIEAALKKENFNFTNILFLNQIHSNQVEIIDEKSKIFGNQNLPKKDAIITNLKNIAIAVITADCSPILIFDENKEIIGAIHAGWRGAKANIVENTILEMKKLGAKNLQAIIGPTIQQNSYEISKDFYEDFLTENKNFEKFFRKTQKQDKFLFNLPKFIEEKLIISGVSNIKNLEIDTYKQRQNYFSYRRSFHETSDNSGRNISLIIIN